MLYIRFNTFFLMRTGCQTEKFQAKYCVFLFRALLARYRWSSAGTLLLNKKHSILELIFRKLQTISKRPQPASFFFLSIRNATFFWILMKICVKHQDQRVDFFVDFDQRGINAKSVVPPEGRTFLAQWEKFST